MLIVTYDIMAVTLIAILWLKYVEQKPIMELINEQI